MLKNTFQHIEGFGSLKEVSLWQSGVFTWDDYINKHSFKNTLFPDEPFVSILDTSIIALNNKDANFFAKSLNSQEYYRIALTFPEDVMFLDIETTGLSKYYDHITQIGWSFQNQFNVYYKGLSKNEFIRAIKRAKCIVTYNGSIFDIPFIKNEFPEIEFPLCQIDLRFFSKRFGYTGGLKKIESEIGYTRDLEDNEISGEIAPVLWHKYKEGNTKALKQLIKYNKEDVESMKLLFDICIENALKNVPIIGNKITPYKFSGTKSKIQFTTKENQKNKIYIKEYKGKVGTAVKINDLPQHKDLSIVGIDLTGSEIKPSGWCHLLYNQAVTKQLLSDDELVAATINTNPHIISIDSPLSLPKGRTSVFDDDPKRDEFGIMRICERILKRRGVSVYPALIPSMQKLTLRGINLADRFRRLGYTVIESYPGAAQDILGIPRKRASLEYLIKGLSSFGIHGDYETTEVSHDELDAITSSMLGYFFWCGMFEALGTDDENYLIIPQIDEKFKEWDDKLVIGLSGGLSSGKTTAGEYIKAKGFEYCRFSMVISKLVTDKGEEPNRKNLQEMGEYVNKEKGQRWLCNTLLNEFLINSSRIVIDGLRFPEDHSFMKEKFGPNFIHIHLACPDEIRAKRYKKEKRNDITFEEAITHPVERDVNKLADLADFIIVNDKDFNNLYTELNKHLK
ncbi:ribonuclease H-like domain-containing protein [Lacibacter sp. MH-610]|uniref:ribonuclease H-like domain-containing protein n=1 Tax=Lacibacter sp. MH-610 TaxID=3020883 RepID=UPI0038912C84